MNLSTQSTTSTQRARRKDSRGESGYALVALIGIMMFSLILTTIAAPQIKRELQREKEEEMLWRAEQVIDAIARYGQPVQGEEGLMKLAEGVQAPGKANKVKFLRRSALCDPLLPCPADGTNWRLIHPGDSGAKDFLNKYKSVLDKLKLEGRINDLQYGQYIQGWTVNSQLLGVTIKGDPLSGSDPQASNPQAGNPNTTGNDTGSTSTSEFGSDKFKENPRVLGVVSKKSDRMFRNYYEVEKYDQAFFFQYIPVQAGGFISPRALLNGGSLGLVSAGPDQRCPQGGVFIDGKCWGGLKDGRCPPSQRQPDGTCIPSGN